MFDTKRDKRVSMRKIWVEPITNGYLDKFAFKWLTELNVRIILNLFSLSHLSYRNIAQIVA